MLADAGRVILGRWGFVVIGLAAVLATASGVNATMFGDANLAYMVSKAGELPKDFARGVWRGGTGGLFIAAAITARFVLFFPLAAVGRDIDDKLVAASRWGVWFPNLFLSRSPAVSLPRLVAVSWHPQRRGAATTYASRTRAACLAAGPMAVAARA